MLNFISLHIHVFYFHVSTDIHMQLYVSFLFPNSDIQIPRELIDNFRNGSKQPISALNEYCSLKRLVVSYREDAVLTYTFKQTFAYVCNVDGKEYPQGIGSTKKEAKANSARIAFNIILGFDKEEVDEDGKIFFFFFIPKHDFFFAYMNLSKFIMIHMYIYCSETGFQKHCSNLLKWVRMNGYFP